MRVLHITTGLELGGAERILYNCAVQGQKEGFSALVVALRSGGPTRHALEKKGIRVVELGASPILPDPRAMWRLLAEIARFKPDTMMSWMYHGNLYGAFAAMLSRHVSRHQLLWGIYNSKLDLGQYSWRMSAVVKAGARLSGYPQAIVYNSSRAQRDHVEIGYRARSSVIINNGVDTLLFKPDPEARAASRKKLGIAESEKVAVIVARVDPQKDWTTVLKGIAMVKDLTTIAVGPTTSQLQPQPGLILHSAHLNMQDLYPAADVFILPSAFGEGTSVAMAEAMACGVPVIVTDVGDNALYAEGCGTVIPAGNPQALADALRLILADREKLAALSAEARAVALKYFGPGTSFKPLFDQWKILRPRKPGS